MKLAIFAIVFIVRFISGSSESENPATAFVILSQATSWHEENVRNLKISIRGDVPDSLIFDTVADFGDVRGALAIWPLLIRLHERLSSNNSAVAWVFFCEDGTIVKGKKLMEFLRNYDPSEPFFLGRGLRDQAASIIHHFAFIGENVSNFSYPDFAGGLAVSWPLIERLVKRLKDGQKPRDFTIDAKHELAMFVWEDGAGTELIDAREFCTVASGDFCITEYAHAAYDRCPRQSDPISNDDVTFAVKTFHEFHKSRIVVVKRTWALEARNVEYFSDREDHYIPTVSLGVDNTERGHCQKTLSILQHFVSTHASKMKWLVIADDDTLLSIPRLLEMLNCYDHKSTVIIGEIYGMIFSASAASLLVDQCKCPTADSPDDMILGICAQNMDALMIHSPALHQARPIDYSKDYLERTEPISFHKHWEVDPYAVYSQWLAKSRSASSGETLQQTDRSEL